MWSSREEIKTDGDGILFSHMVDDTRPQEEPFFTVDDILYVENERKNIPSTATACEEVGHRPQRPMNARDFIFDSETVAE